MVAMKCEKYTYTERMWTLPDGIHQYWMIRTGAYWLICVYDPRTQTAGQNHKIVCTNYAALAKSKELAMKHYRGANVSAK